MLELEALQEINPEIRQRGAQIVALTPELERYTRNVRKRLNLTFDILTNLHLKTAEQFRLAFVLPDYLRELYESFGSTLDRFHDESEYRLPMPARYVIDKVGAFYRRIQARSGAGKATVATARKLAERTYRLLKYGEGYVRQEVAAYEASYRERLVNDLSRRAAESGYHLEPIAAGMHT